MEIEDIISVLQSVKRREIADNAKINKICVNPSESIGAKAIDAAIQVLREKKERESEPKPLTLEEWEDEQHEAEKD